jgi:hypothetical protein
VTPQGAPQDEQEDKRIYCANCAHCVVFKQLIEDAEAYVLRVRCSMGIWKKKSGEEKVYKYFSIARRTIVECDHYDPMGDEKSFIKELRKNLPVKDEIYSYSNLRQQEPRSDTKTAPR